MTFEEWWRGTAGKSISVLMNAALRSIAAAAWDAAEKAAQPKWQSIEKYVHGTPALFGCTEAVALGNRMEWQVGTGENRDGEFIVLDEFGEDTGLGADDLIGWMPLSPAPEKTK